MRSKSPRGVRQNTLNGPRLVQKKRSGSLASHYIDIEDDSEACFEQDGGDARLLPSPSPDKEECHTFRQRSPLQLPPVPAAVAQFVPSEAAAVPSLQRTQSMPFQLEGEQAVDKAQLAIASQAGKGRKSPVTPDAAGKPATEPQTLEVQTDKAVVNYDKAAQGDTKQPAGGSSDLIAAFRPVGQLSASSAAAPSPVSTAGNNASDRQAAGDVQGFDNRSYLDALLLRAKILRLELPAHRPENACEKESAVCPFSLEGEITVDEEAAAPHTAAPVNMASPLPSWPDLTGGARVPRPQEVPGQQSQFQRQHSPDTSAAVSALADAITPAADGSLSSRDVSAQSSPDAVSLLQPQQAVGDAQSTRSTGAAASAMLADEIGSRVQDAAANQPLGSSSATADVVQSPAAVDGGQICHVKDDRQSVDGGQAHASAEEVASQVQDATADASPQVHGRATVAHAALATFPAVNAESAPTNAASAMAVAAADAQIASDADLARRLQHEENCKSAGRDSGAQSVKSISALQADGDRLQAEFEALASRPKLRPISTSSQASSLLSWEEVGQLQLEMAIALSLGQSAMVCVGGQAPLETRAEADKDTPWGRLPLNFSHVRSIKGDGNCFYRAMLAAVVEGLCLDPRPARIAALSEAFISQQSDVESCPAIDHHTKALALQGHNFLQDMLQGLGKPGKTWHGMLEVLNNQDMDQAMLQFLRAITARELWANKLKYDWCTALDVYSGLSYDAILQHETLRMTAEAEELHAMALTAVLPVRLKLLDVTGDEPRVSTYEPGLPLSRPRTSTQAHTAADGAAESPQQVWLRYRPGHYEVVYPAKGFENVDGASKTWQQA